MATLTTTEKEKIQELRSQGAGIREISRTLQIIHHKVYEVTGLAEKDFSSTKDYLDFRARERGYGSFKDYNREYNHTKRKQNQAIYQDIDLGSIVDKKLKELGKNKTWLGQQLGVTRSMASHITNNVVFPSFETLTKLIHVLLTKKENLENNLESI